MLELKIAYESIKAAWKELFKDFYFTKITMEEGNEMVRLSLPGRNDYRPYIRVDFWRVGYRISYAPDYYQRYWANYNAKLTDHQQAVITRYIGDIHKSAKPSDFIEVTYNEHVVREPKQVWRLVCIKVEAEGWLK